VMDFVDVHRHAARAQIRDCHASGLKACS
jgi:hypothetical protein